MSVPLDLVMLPPETVEIALGHLSRGDLVQTLTTNSFFHLVAARLLYRTLIDVPSKQTVRLLNTLARNNVYPHLVLRFDLEWTENIPTSNLFRLLQRALQRLTHLTYLGLEFSAPDNVSSLAWILSGCPFALRVFTTSMRYDAALVHFLATQHTLVEICLRGFNPGTARIALPADALPRLTHFRTVLAAPHITAEVVRGRPVESVSMSLYPDQTSSSLDALLLSTRPLKRLTVMSFDTAPPASLVLSIATRFPALEALHVVVLLRHSTHASLSGLSSSFPFAHPPPAPPFPFVEQTLSGLLEAASSLSHFTRLRYLTFMAPGTFDDDEHEIATQWHAACPTLRTIILPEGIMWAYVDDRWIAVQDADLTGAV